MQQAKEVNRSGESLQVLDNVGSAEGRPGDFEQEQPDRPTSRVQTRPLVSWRPLAAGLVSYSLAAGLSGCFTGDGAEGALCSSDASCGSGLSCTEGVCGGPQDDAGGDGDCGVGTVLIPGGSYTNGGSPQAERIVGDVCMDQDEVTVAEFTLCVADGGCTSADTDPNCNYGVSGRENHPVNCVDWFQAEAYCTWSGQRLPTQWEWEWAARGREAGRTYPWGEETPSCQYAVFEYDGAPGCGQDRTWEVGSKSPAGDSRDGLRDMAGNVIEWTGSWFDSSEVQRVLRGGHWLTYIATFLRADLSYVSDPSNRDHTYGFRCARTR